jgi:flagellar biosynthesis/type III secretory pathway protein FliH
MPLDIVLPIAVKRVEKSDAPAIDSGEDHGAGYKAGYEEGKLRAEWEAQRQRLKDAAGVQALTRSLEKLQAEYETLLAEHLPELVQDALHRVYRAHPFTPAEISGEVTALLRDMEQASRLTLECSTADADELHRRLEECDAIPEGGKWALEPNPLLKPGEFLLKSDLGDVDGRHSSRIRQIHLALEGKA